MIRVSVSATLQRRNQLMRDVSWVPVIDSRDVDGGRFSVLLRPFDRFYRFYRHFKEPE
jgi:hypothetical protein